MYSFYISEIEKYVSIERGTRPLQIRSGAYILFLYSCGGAAVKRRFPFPLKLHFIPLSMLYTR